MYTYESPKKSHKSQFQPSNPYPQSITSVEYRYGKLEVFSAIEVCNYFPNLEEIRLTTPLLGLSELAPDALNLCKNLKKFYISATFTDWNQYTEIPNGFFANNPEIEEIAFIHAPIKSIKPDQFAGLSKLQKLRIAATDIEKLPVSSIKDSKSLRSIWVYSNPMTDFPVEQLLENFPELEEATYGDSEIPCSRVREIFDLFSAKGVQSLTWDVNRKHEQEIDKVEGMICVADNQ